jgi:F0F1-type ATP synthase membrane subunit b/b'
MPTLIDTRDAFRRLREGGLSEEQADAIVELFRDTDEVATHGDIEELDEHLTHRIELSEERLGQKMEQIRTSLTRTVVSAVAAVGAVLAVVIL